MQLARDPKPLLVRLAAGLELARPPRLREPLAPHAHPLRAGEQHQQPGADRERRQHRWCPGDPKRRRQPEEGDPAGEHRDRRRGPVAGHRRRHHRENQRQVVRSLNVPERHVHQRHAEHEPQHRSRMVAADDKGERTQRQQQVRQRVEMARRLARRRPPAASASVAVPLRRRPGGGTDLDRRGDHRPADVAPPQPASPPRPEVALPVGHSGTLAPRERRVIACREHLALPRRE